MTKRSTERAVDELNEEVLGNLTPEERLKFMIEAMSQGKEGWVEQLRETTPKRDYRGVDTAVLNRYRLGFILAQQACYDLWTAWLRYQWLSTQHSNEMLAELFDLPKVSDHAPDDWRTDYEGRSIEKLIEMYVDYHSYERFASEVLDVSLETWLTAMHPDAETILPAVEETVDMKQATIDAIDVDLADTSAERDEGRSDEETQQVESLDEIVAQETDGLRDLWNEMIGPKGSSSVRFTLGEL